MRVRNCVAARCNKAPTTIAVRLATVGPLFGTFQVSGVATSIHSNGTPSASAVICASIVVVPWPISRGGGQRLQLARRVSTTAARLASITSPRPVKPAP